MTTTQRKRIQDIRRFNQQYGGTVSGSLADYLAVYMDFCRNDGDYSRSIQTRLYREHGGEYCTLLEVLSWYYSDHRQPRKAAAD